MTNDTTPPLVALALAVANGEVQLTTRLADSELPRAFRGALTGDEWVAELLAGRYGWDGKTVTWEVDGKVIGDGLNLEREFADALQLISRTEDHLRGEILAEMR